MPRPTEYTETLAQQICNIIAASANGLVMVCSKKGMPDYTTIMQWLTDPDKKDFQQSYQRAREAQADLMADEIIDIADQHLDEKTSPAQITQIKLRIETRQWKAARLAPAKYGNKPVTANAENASSEPADNFIVCDKWKIPV